MDIIGTLTNGLQEYGLARTRETLGDRTRYIGMSDIGKAGDCLRATVAAKLANSASSPTLEKMLRLNRGHWFEAGIAEAFRASGQSFLYQLAIQSVFRGTLIKGHVDFVFIDPRGEVHLVEFKSCSRLPDTAYASHETQLFGQRGTGGQCTGRRLKIPDARYNDIPAPQKGRDVHCPSVSSSAAGGHCRDVWITALTYTASSSLSWEYTSRYVL